MGGFPNRFTERTWHAGRCDICFRLAEAERRLPGKGDLSGVHDSASPRPLLLDLYSGAGGAAVGVPPCRFRRCRGRHRGATRLPVQVRRHDALQFLEEHARSFDAVHASPPLPLICRTNRGNNGNHLAHPDLVADTRRALDRTALPYVIENVPDAPLRDPVTLCGEMFGLRVIRHRLFESNLPLLQPDHRRHRGRVHAPQRTASTTRGCYFTVAGPRWWRRRHPRPTGRPAMGIDWMTTKRALTQAVPPAYTELVGARLLAGMRRVAA